jgi:hypothetical protein
MNLATNDVWPMWACLTGLADVVVDASDETRAEDPARADARSWSGLCSGSLAYTASDGAAILKKPVSDRAHWRTYHNPGILILWRRKSLILNGEMSEWSIEHAWKACTRQSSDDAI